MTGPLDGILVLALEQAVAAPYCTSRLADAGARVIKVERAEGDFARFYDAAVAPGLSSYFVWLNRGKESLVADLKNPADQALLRSIALRADVVVQNLAPGAAVRVGLGSDALRAANPRLVTVDISGYGDAGEYAAMKAYDLLVQAESGLASITGHPAGPGRVGVSACDIGTGMAAHAAVLEALLGRERSGEGAAIRCSLFDTMADWMTAPLLYYEGTGVMPARLGLAHPSICPYGAFATREGALLLISIQNEREWAAFCAGFLGDASLAAKPGWESNVARVAHRSEVDAHIGAAFAALSQDEAARRLRSCGTAYGRVNDLASLARHPVLRRTQVATPAGPANLVAPPARSGSGARAFGAVPGIGADSGAIRREFGEALLSI